MQPSNPIVWNAIFDANTGQTVNSTPANGALTMLFRLRTEKRSDD
jgi:hypothetical protein